MTEMDPTRHLVNLSAGGCLHRSGELQTPAAELPYIFQGLVESGLDSLTIYFHGGGTDERAGLELAADLYNEICDQFQSYPVFFLWETGLLETLQSQMLDILTCSPLFLKLYRKLLKHTARKLTTALRMEAVTGGDVPVRPDHYRMLEVETLPVEDLASLSLAMAIPEKLDELTDAEAMALQEDLASDAEVVQLLGDVLAHARQVRVAASREAAESPGRDVGYLSSQVLDDLLAASSLQGSVLEGEGAASAAPMLLTSPSAWFFGARLLARIVGRFQKGTDHGLVGTVLEEMYRQLYADKVGTYLWNEMKENASDAYAANPAGPPNDSFHGGTLFIDLLKQHLDQHGFQKINLVGFSAGSIHICHFVERAAQVLGDEFKFQNVVFLAPAANFRTFRAGIVDHADRIANMSIFVMADEYEKRDPLVKLAPLVYPHSLLYLVSGLFEAEPDTPLVGLARHLQGERYLGDEAVRAGRQYLDRLAEEEEVDESVVYSVTTDNAPPGQRARFTSHYGKAHGPSYDRSTLESVAVLIRPAPIPMEDLRPVSLQLTPEMRRLMEPGGTGEPVHRRRRAAVPEPVEEPARRGRRTAVPERRDPRRSRPRQIIGDDEIVDHSIVTGLISVGRCIARVVIPGVNVNWLVDFPPEERETRWQEAETGHHLRPFTGTGWVLGKARRVLVTNNHVLPLPQVAQLATAEFGYERGIRTEARAQRVIGLSPSELFFTSANFRFGGLDYTAVALNQPAPEELGYLEPSQGITADRAENIFVVQHPRGRPKKYVVNHNRKVNMTDRYVAYVSDTEEGSSGSPLFDDRMRLVGIHHLGGHKVVAAGREQVANLGSRIEVVIVDLIQQLIDARWDEGSIRHWFGEGFVLRNWRRIARHQ